MADPLGARRLWPLAVVSLLLLGLVWLHVQATLLGYRTAAAREDVERLEARNAYLRLELERLNSPESLEREARGRLGMQRPDPAQMVVLPPGLEPAAEPAAFRHGPLQLASAFLKRLTS